MNEKQCSKCGETKPLDAFYASSGRHRGGVRPWCKACHRWYGLLWHAANRDVRRKAIA